MSASAPAISVVIPCYNYREYVCEAIDSALAQTLQPCEVIVVDDGSTDGSDAVLRERYQNDPRVTLICKSNGGQLSAFKAGLAASRGGILAFLDADDRWKPDYLEQLAVLYSARRDVDFIFSDLALFDEDQRVIRYADRETDLGYTAIMTLYTQFWYGAPTSALSMRRTVAEFCLDMPAAMDPLWRICADNCLVFGASLWGARKYYLPTGAVEYRIHGGNGWWAKKDLAGDYLTWMRNIQLTRFYAERLHMRDTCIELLKHEYMTKPEPTWEETVRYARLSKFRKGSRLKNYNRALSILGRGRKHRDHCPVELPPPSP